MFERNGAYGGEYRMSMLGYYIRRVRESRGMEHAATIQALREYIKTESESSLLSAIQLLDNQDYIRVLWEAGLREPLRSAALRRLEEIMSRKYG